MNSSPQHFRDLLQQQCDASSQLLAILDQEHTAISGNKLQDLEPILAAKLVQVSQLEAASREFLELLHQQSSLEKIDISNVMSDIDPHGTLGLVPLWQRVKTILSKCRHSNNINGKIITLNQHHAQLALNILRTGQPGSGPCYSSTGARPYVAASRTLGKV